MRSGGYGVGNVGASLLQGFWAPVIVCMVEALQLMAEGWRNEDRNGTAG